MSVHSRRSLRTRRTGAILAWSALALTAFWLSNGRYTGKMIIDASPVVAFILSAFSAFVGVFAWLLFNPTRRSVTESPVLLWGTAATLFAPAVIGFCLLPSGSALRPWLALGLFVLCVTAILSYVPEDFFAVPRNRYSYLAPLPAFDGVRDDALDPGASWFRWTELSELVPDCERPSLAPRSYLQHEPERSPAADRPLAAAAVVPTGIDDILGTEFDVSLLDDPVWEIDDDPEVSQPPPSPDQRGRSSQSVRSEQSGSIRPVADQPGTQRQQSVRQGDDRSAVDDVADNRARTAPLVRPQSDHERGVRTLSENRVHQPAAHSLPAGRTAEPGLPGSAAHKRPSRQHGDREIAAHSAHSLPSDQQRTVDGKIVRHDQAASSSQSPAETEVPARARSERLSRQLDADESELSDHLQQSSILVDNIVAETAQKPVVPEHRRDVSEGRPEVHRYRTQERRTSGAAPAARTTDTTGARSTNAAEPLVRKMPELVRTTDKAGNELVEGVMKVRFEKGQKRANIHIPFSPPLSVVPEVECECVGAEQLRLKVPVRQTWGIRIEARRSRTDQPLEAEVGFAALAQQDA